MTTHKNIDKICCAVLALILILTLLFVNAESLGVQAVSASIGYESRLFDTSRVHTIDIVMDDWDGFLETCENEEYADCSLLIDNDAYKNVGIRAKGNTSLSSVSAYGNDRYSFKIEFDCYDKTKSYYGLDKISLNNIIQDNTYMKDYFCYQMMGYLGVASPLCSFVYITINGEDWGLYLAVEGVEESFLERNYGNDYGELYKPESSGQGGGNPPNQSSHMNDVDATDNISTTNDMGNNDISSSEWDSMNAEMGGKNGGRGGIGGMSLGGDDVSLVYTDDEYESYSNIFDNAKTDITDTDKDRLIASLKKLNQGKDIESTVNIEEVIRYFVVHNYVCNFDSYTGSIIHNYYLYEKDGQMSMIPWDYNLAFGGFQDMTDADTLVNYPIDTPVSSGTIESRPMLSWIFSSEEYTQLYHEYFQEFITEYFDSGYFEETIDTVTEIIAPYVEKDPTKFCTYEEFEKGAAALKEFCLLRSESVSAQLDGLIPSTSDGQSADNTSLIDASSVAISDMGSMGTRGNMGKKDAVSAAAVQTQNSQNTTDGQTFTDEDAASIQQSTNSDSSSAQQSSGSDSSSAQQPPDSDISSVQQPPNPGNMEMPDGFDGGFPDNMDRPEGGRGGMNNTNVSETQTADPSTAIVLLAVSVVFLAIGLIFVFKFKR